MVVHSPDAFEAKKAAAAAAASAQRSADDVPPSVLNAGSVTQQTAASVTPAEEADLLGESDAIVHDFGSWDGDRRARETGEAEKEKEEISFGAAGRRGQRLVDRHTSAADDDKISVADSFHGVPPPASDLPQLNPFTPEWFTQVIGAAASAAATAAATAAVAGAARVAAPAPAINPSVPRRLNDRKVPDFWEDRPEFWFQIFDAHLNHFRPSERQCFDALLPLLTPAARSTVHSVIRTPGTAPYSKAREALLRHFGRTPRQLAREARESRSMGDKLPSEYLDHIMGLLPDVRTFYEIALLDALSPNARVAALQHSGTGVEAMARAADAVVLESRAEAELPRSVNALSLLDDEFDGPSGPPPISPTVAAVARPQRKSDALCGQHARWGKKAYKCQSPSTCRMSKIIFPKPASSSSAPGNGKAGGQ